MCCVVAKLCLTLLRPHGLWPVRIFCPWDFPTRWSELPFLSPGDLPDPGIEPESLALESGFFTIGPPEMLFPIPYSLEHPECRAGAMRPCEGPLAEPGLVQEFSLCLSMDDIP